jgi:CheY-like chemotaxis protein
MARKGEGMKARLVQTSLLMPEPTAIEWQNFSATTEDRAPRLARPPRVLLVDDEEEFLELTRTILEDSGFVVECARAAGEAVARAVANPPDVILLDILLPGCDGLEILETLRGEPETSEVPVLACTALGQRDSGPLLVQAGFDGLVAKPIDWHDLERLLAAVIAPNDGQS